MSRQVEVGENLGCVLVILGLAAAWALVEIFKAVFA